ncbi:MAG: hypothetical protein AAGE52_03885 [Myxococcota bacterium]
MALPAFESHEAARLLELATTLNEERDIKAHKKLFRAFTQDWALLWHLLRHDALDVGNLGVLDLMSRALRDRNAETPETELLLKVLRDQPAGLCPTEAEPLKKLLLPNWPSALHCIASFAARDADQLRTALSSFRPHVQLGAQFALGLSGEPIDREVKRTLYEHVARAIGRKGGNRMAVLHNDNDLQDYIVHEEEKVDPLVRALGDASLWYEVGAPVVLARARGTLASAQKYLVAATLPTFLDFCLSRTWTMGDGANFLRIVRQRNDDPDEVASLAPGVETSEHRDVIALGFCAQLQERTPHAIQALLPIPKLRKLYVNFKDALDLAIPHFDPETLRRALIRSPEENDFLLRYHFDAAILRSLLQKGHRGRLTWIGSSAVPTIVESLKEDDRDGDERYALVDALLRLLGQEKGPLSDIEEHAWTEIRDEVLHDARPYSGGSCDWWSQHLAQFLARFDPSESAQTLKEMRSIGAVRPSAYARFIHLMDESVHLEELLRVLAFIKENESRRRKSKDPTLRDECEHHVWEAEAGISTTFKNLKDPTELAVQAAIQAQVSPKRQDFLRRTLGHPKFAARFRAAMAEA